MMAASAAASRPYPRVCVSVDRGGTFTDVYATILRSPEAALEAHALKLLSVDPGAYADAPTEGIRRILCIATGEDRNPKHAPVDTDHIDEIRMGTTVATNALLERDGCRTALVVSAGLAGLLEIGTQARPNIFDLSVRRPGMLYEAVVEANERVVFGLSGPNTEREQLSSSPTLHPQHHPPALHVERPLDLPSLREALAKLREQGISSLAVALMHSYGAPEHEHSVAREAAALGFEHVSLSSALTPMVKVVPRAFTAVVDAYLTPKIRAYLASFRAGFKHGLQDVNVQFMRSDGGLCSMDDFSGYLAILSGPAGGVVGYAKTAYEYSKSVVAQRSGHVMPVIGFDMGGTSTDVSRYGGHLEHTFETETAGVTIQAPQLDISTVAAGGGSRLFYRGGLFAVGPESAGAHPGPVCYRKGGHLAVTDANLLLGRVIPELFPSIFGVNADEPLDVPATKVAFTEFTSKINTCILEEAVEGGEKAVSMTPEEVALGFIKVANEAMCRPIRQITEAKGHDVRDHTLACFGGAGGQHACAVARSLGIKTVFVHRYSGILSAYGISLAESVAELQEPLGVPYDDGRSDAALVLETLEHRAASALEARGFSANQIRFERYLNLRYDGTDFSMMVETAATHSVGTESPFPDYFHAFIEMYRHEHGFTIPGRTVVIDDVRVRALGAKSPRNGVNNMDVLLAPEGQAPGNLRHIMDKLCYFEETGGFTSTGVFRWEETVPSVDNVVEVRGPAIVIDKDATIVIEPGCLGRLTANGDLAIEIGKPLDSMAMGSATSTTRAPAVVDKVKLSIYGHRFMGIAEQMGRTLQRTAISVNIKERLDFSCALFDPSGGLVANAPHVPVHLGSMQDAVRYQIQLLGSSWKAGEVLLCNHPIAGGTHLPDVTVITPVYYEDAVVFYVASRGHQADIGGIVPGSMPPFSKQLSDEGMAVESMKIVKDGLFQEDELVRRLTEAGGRCVNDVVSDIRAQVAANKKGIMLVSELIRVEGLSTVHAYMKHIQHAAADAVRGLLRRVAHEHNLATGDPITAEDVMDDGSPIKLTLAINGENGSATFDFEGTGPSVSGNTNAPRAIAASAVIYALRSLVGEDIPMNQGCLDPVTIKLPSNSLLNPGMHCAVAGGNVLTSQRVVDVIFKAFRACAASQGCMNNLTFGDASMGYYETIAGGAGAGPTWHGSSGVQTHMTNTRITDPEILERRYPVVLRKFHLREGSGGGGKWHGGDGVVREIEFRRPVTVSILSERREYAPWGLAGGQDGKRGRNILRRQDGSEISLGGKNTQNFSLGDAIRICTPGGGGYGRNEP
jgi:5-oxoprolinase (ATP-hydrolysing)